MSPMRGAPKKDIKATPLGGLYRGEWCCWALGSGLDPVAEYWHEVEWTW